MSGSNRIRPYQKPPRPRPTSPETQALFDVLDHLSGWDQVRKIMRESAEEALRQMQEDEARQLRLKKGTHMNIVEAAEQAKRRRRR